MGISYMFISKALATSFINNKSLLRILFFLWCVKISNKVYGSSNDILYILEGHW